MKGPGKRVARIRLYLSGMGLRDSLGKGSQRGLKYANIRTNVFQRRCSFIRGLVSFEHGRSGRKMDSLLLLEALCLTSAIALIAIAITGSWLHSGRKAVGD